MSVSNEAYLITRDAKVREIERLRKEMERILLETTDDTTRADLQAVLDHK